MCNFCILSCSKRGVVPGLKEVIFPLYSALVRLHLEFFVHFSAPENSKDMNKLGRVTGKCHKVEKRTGASCLQRKVERTRTVEAEEEKTP